MSKTTDDILNNAMRLSTTERAELAAALLASLDGEPDDAVEAAWAAEAVARTERVDAWCTSDGKSFELITPHSAINQH